MQVNDARQFGIGEYTNIELDGKRNVACIQEKNLPHPPGRGAAGSPSTLVPTEFGSWKSLLVEVMAVERAITERFL